MNNGVNDERTDLDMLAASVRCTDCGEVFHAHPEYKHYPSMWTQLERHEELRHPKPTIVDVAAKLDRIIELLSAKLETPPSEEDDCVCMKRIREKQ